MRRRGALQNIYMFIFQSIRLHVLNQQYLLSSANCEFIDLLCRPTCNFVPILDAKFFKQLISVTPYVRSLK